MNPAEHALNADEPPMSELGPETDPADTMGAGQIARDSESAPGAEDSLDLSPGEPDGTGAVDEIVQLADQDRGSAPLAPGVDLNAEVEAILFVVEAPVSVASVAAAIQQPADAVAAAIESIRVGYDERGAGIELRDVAGGVRIFTRPDVAAQVELFLQDGQRSRLTQAALETLAVVAYRQPVTRSRVSAIRGVNVDGVVRTLTTRGLVVEAGSDPETGGGLLATTDLFLEKMGLTSLTELPSLAPLLPELDGLETDEL